MMHKVFCFHVKFILRYNQRSKNDQIWRKSTKNGCNVSLTLWLRHKKTKKMFSFDHIDIGLEIMLQVFVYEKKCYIKLKPTVQKWSILAQIANNNSQKIAMCCQSHSHTHWMFQKLFYVILYILDWRWCTKFLFSCEVHNKVQPTVQKWSNLAQIN